MRDLFNWLIYRASTESQVAINIYQDTIWIKDCGFGFDDGYLYINPKSGDEVARWAVPFWQRFIMELRFKYLVNKIVKRNREEILAKLTNAENEKDREAQEAALRRIGYLK